MLEEKMHNIWEKNNQPTKIYFHYMVKGQKYIYTYNLTLPWQLLI